MLGGCNDLNANVGGRRTPGSMLLQSVINQSVRDGIDHIYLHVQTSNRIAIQFYHKFGFEITETIRNYYKRIEPPDCYILLKKLHRQPTE